MNALEDKAVSRALAKKAGVPTPPGSDGVVENEQDALAVAKKIGYPVMIKAIAGGGGRGMRAAHNDISLIKGFHTARNEAEKAFGNSGVYIEKYIENPHHVEFQILGDNRGHIIHLGRARLFHSAPQSEGRRGISFAADREQVQEASRENGQGCGENRRRSQLHQCRDGRVHRR